MKDARLGCRSNLVFTLSRLRSQNDLYHVAMYNGHMIEVSATEYKHNALKLLEQVRTSGETVQISKRGRPIARLVRVDEAASKRVFGEFRGDAVIVGDIVGPILDPADWGDLA